MSQTPIAQPGQPVPAREAPGRLALLGRTLVIIVINVVALWFLDWLLPGFAIDGVGRKVVAGIILGLLNSIIWPFLSAIVVPFSVLTLGFGTVILNAFTTRYALTLIPEVRVDTFATGLIVSAGLAILGGLIASALAVDDDTWFDGYFSIHTRGNRSKATTTDIPGAVIVQIDGLARPVLERSLAGGDVPTLHRWLTDESHQLVSWETEWSSQTSVSQCGILHGSSKNMPAFRWLEKETGELFVSNHPKSATKIEQRHSDGEGLLANDGSSYGNLFTGDAARSVMTMSGVGQVKEGKIGAGYARYFSRPDQAIRTAGGVIRDLYLERRGNADQRRRGVEPRIDRGYIYAGLRAFTTVVSRDICVSGILGDMAEGRSVIYCDLLGYDEVSHHSGPERADTLAVLRNIDKQIARLERAASWSARPYRLVVLSDHGQSQGTPFSDRYGEQLSALVERLTGVAAAVDPDSEAGNTESTAWVRTGRDKIETNVEAATVLASGNLGLIYLPGEKHRMTRAEIDAAHPELIEGLRTHPGIGFLLVATDSEGGGVILGPDGQVDVQSGEVTGTDPLSDFGPNALTKIQTAHRYNNVADLMVNSMIDPALNEVAAFEHQVGSHGGLGGPQNEPFVLFPMDANLPDEPISSPAVLHQVLKQYLFDLGQPVTLTEDPQIVP